MKVLYDFDGEADNGELSIRENQVLTIIRQDVGDGWWEAETSNKQKGLIPEAYVEVRLLRVRFGSSLRVWVVFTQCAQIHIKDNDS